MDFGGAEGHIDWFTNNTTLMYSLRAVGAALSFIQTSGPPQSYTLAPINEPVDSQDFSTFGTPAALIENGAAWVRKYIQSVIMKVRTVDPEISIMSQGSSKGEPYWSPSFSSSTNLGFNVHNYYFAYRLTESDTDSAVVCNDAKLSAVGGKVPVFVGGWSVQTASDSKFANRENNLNTGLFAFGKCTQSSAYWIAKLSGDMKVDGGIGGRSWIWAMLTQGRGRGVVPERV